MCRMPLTSPALSTSRRRRRGAMSRHQRNDQKISTRHRRRLTQYDLGSLSYDAASRITGISPTSNKIASISSGSTNFTPTYDANGSLTSDPKNSYSYDSAEQLIAPAGYGYVYNGLRQRVQKTTSATTNSINTVTGNATLAPVIGPVLGLVGGTLQTVLPTVLQTTSTVGSPAITNYAYDDAGHLLGEYHGTGVVIQETIWLNDQPIATVTANGTYYIHSDQLNTPRQIDNAQGQAVWAWEPVTYGATAPNEDPRNTGTKFPYSQRYRGQTFDTETGLSDNLNRTFNANLLGYNQVDPLGLAGGRFNPRGYANQNPISFNDPTGLEPFGFQGMSAQQIAGYATVQAVMNSPAVQTATLQSSRAAASQTGQVLSLALGGIAVASTGVGLGLEVVGLSGETLLATGMVTGYGSVVVHPTARGATDAVADFTIDQLIPLLPAQLRLPAQFGNFTYGALQYRNDLNESGQECR